MIKFYLYYYDNYEYLILYLRKLMYNIQFSNNVYDRFKLNGSGKGEVVIVYKEFNIVAINCDSQTSNGDIKGLSLMKKVDLLDKDLFDKLFEEKFSQNLCNVSVNIDILGSEEELVEYQGHRLLDMNLLEQFDFYDYNSNTRLKAYSLQPKGYRYLLKVNSINELEFNNKLSYQQIESILEKLIIIVKLIDWRR